MSSKVDGDEHPAIHLAPFAPEVDLASDPTISSNTTSKGTDLPVKTILPPFSIGGTPWLPDKLWTQDEKAVADSIASDFSLARLEQIRRHLWFAGLLFKAPVSLTHSLTLSRTVILTDRADMHLVTHAKKMYLKPLPDCLLSSPVWSKFICSTPTTHDRAVFLLLSYHRFLIRPITDLSLPHGSRLIPEEISCEKWVNFRLGTSQGLMPSAQHRYYHGEMSLARLNWIYRLT